MNEENICECGKPLIPVFNNGVQIGVSHENAEDEDWHNKYFSSAKIIERQKQN